MWNATSGKWLFGFGDDAMVGENGMGNHGHIPFGQCGTPGAIIGGCLVLP